MNWGIKGKVLLPILILGILICIGVVWQVIEFSHRQTTSASLATAESLAGQIRELRGYYTRQVVATVASTDLEVSHDYASRPGAIPLPATMIHELNAILTKKEGYTIRLYSDFPFPFRTDGGPRDDFERQALQALTKNPAEVFWRQETYAGVPSIRYASADLMVAQACVDCHNAHPLTPKDNWKLGDLRGAIEVILPIDAALAEAERQVVSLSLLIGLGILVGLVAIGLITNRVLTPLRWVEERARAIAQGDLRQESLAVSSADEIGRLAQTFNSMLANLRQLTEQAQVIAADDLENEALDHPVSGDLGDAFVKMVEKMKWIANQARFIADHDLYHPQLQDEGSGTLGTSMATMVKNLRAQIEKSAELAEEIKHQASEARAQGEAAERQRQQMHQVAEQLTVLLNNQAQSAEVASATAQGASQTALQGAEVMQKTIASMERLAARVSSSAQTITELGDNSVQISTIVAVINDIAGQTKLLALNATIEAAHAGDFGQGFAVVASEVHDLAKRISIATQEIDDMVGRIQVNTNEVVASMEKGSREAGEGAKLAAQSGSALQQISEGVSQVDELVGQLSASIAEQARTSSTLMRGAEQ
jgi:methyl-accepting chemotaxis protein